MNGPPTSSIDINKYTQEYLARRGNRVCNPPTGSQTRRESSESSSAPSTDASDFSALFVQ